LTLSVKNKVAIETPRMMIENTIAVRFASLSFFDRKQNPPANIGNQINKSGNVK